MRLMPPILALLACCQLALAQAQAPSELVKAQLLADVSTVKQGQPFTVGILMKLAPHYHVYWLNPGDSGRATSVELKAFPNATVELLPMPTPFRIELPGGLINYGYENEVMLLAKVTPHVNPKMDTDKLDLTGQVSWLVCSESECIPGQAPLALSLPFGATAAPDHVAEINAWRQAIPSDAKQAADVETTIGSLPSDLVIRIRWRDVDPGTLRDVQWFPGDNDPITFKDIKVESSGGTTVVRARVELPPGQTFSRNTIESVLGYTDGHGARRGLNIPVSLAPSPKLDQGK
jgi:thiol:disulfide interchange protein DsbD